MWSYNDNTDNGLSQPYQPILQPVQQQRQQQQEQPPVAKSESGPDSAREKPSWMKFRKTKRLGSMAKTEPKRRMRNMLRPRNSTMVLNELHPSLECVFSDGGPSTAYRAQITFNGRRFIGVGCSKSQARASASELVLCSLVQPDPVSPPSATAAGAEAGASGGGGEAEVAGDGELSDTSSTPWMALAAFAMHKLLSDWHRGDIGHTPASFGPRDQLLQQLADRHRQLDVIEAPAPPAAPAMAGSGGGRGGDSARVEKMECGSVAGANGEGVANSDGTLTRPSKKRKKAAAAAAGRRVTLANSGEVVSVPDNALDIHPVTLLTRLCPRSVFVCEPQFNITSTSSTPAAPPAAAAVVAAAAPSQRASQYVARVSVSGHNFSSSARTKKLARAGVARMALQQVFAITYPQDDHMDSADYQTL